MGLADERRDRRHLVRHAAPDRPAPHDRYHRQPRPRPVEPGRPRQHRGRLRQRASAARPADGGAVVDRRAAAVGPDRRQPRLLAQRPAAPARGVRLPAVHGPGSHLAARVLRPGRAHRAAVHQPGRDGALPCRRRLPAPRA